MNNLLEVDRKAAAVHVDKNYFKHGISTLHLWIRNMEMFLHISHRLEFKSWQARGENKEALKQKKKCV